MQDDHWREPIAAVAERFHCQTLSTVGRSGHGSPLDVTSSNGHHALEHRLPRPRDAAIAGAKDLVPDNLLAQVAPFGWEHITLSGD